MSDTTDGSEPAERAPSLRVLTVCTHNRTRSVMMEAFLRSMLAERLGDGVVTVRSAGFGPEDIPAISDAVDAMRRRGLDVTAHRSRKVDADVLRAADLVLTAERDHVIRIASIDPAAYRRALTLPEFIGAASRTIGDIGVGASFSSWLQEMTQTRTSLAYLRDPIEEVDDPTGLPGRAFEAAVVDIESQCSMAASVIARVLHDA